jgi:hypothetical protein
LVEGLKRLPETKLPKLPRIADFAPWVTACETAFWPIGTFWAAYCGNRDETVEGVIEADPIAAAVRALMTTRTEWTGTASELLGALAEQAGERVAKAKTWPDSPRALAGRLPRAATFLRKIGVRSASGVRAAPEAGSSVSPPQPHYRQLGRRLDRPNDADGRGGGLVPTVRATPMKFNGGTDADGADTNHRPNSAPEKAGWTARL